MKSLKRSRVYSDSSYCSVETSDSLYNSIIQKADEEDDCRNLFVRRVPFSATSEQLRVLYEPFGTLVDCTVVTDKVTKESKGYAFVKYQKAASALKAVEAELRMGEMDLCTSFACKNAKSSPRCRFPH